MLTPAERAHRPPAARRSARSDALHALTLGVVLLLIAVHSPLASAQVVPPDPSDGVCKSPILTSLRRPTQVASLAKFPEELVLHVSSYLDGWELGVAEFNGEIWENAWWMQDELGLLLAIGNEAALSFLVD